MFKKPLYNFLYSLFLVLLTAGFSSYFNRTGLKNFYPYIKLSALTPPNIVFPFVWIFLYALLALAFDRILNHRNPDTQKRKLQLKNCSQAFVINLFLHVLWTIVFFYNAYFLAGLIILVLLVFSTVVMAEFFYKTDKIAGILLLPYLFWLLFATYLNWVVVELNGAYYVF
ncbi:MAG: tryptophan-rich sensory protein [Alphaproteobacteria bacterium]|nr:tryptophan-rich sensory protein [Alphaproteobacteria bacterium]